MGVPDWRRNAPRVKKELAREAKLTIDHEMNDNDLYVLAINGNMKTGIHRKQTLMKKFKEQNKDWNVQVVSVCKDGNARLSTVINKELKYGKIAR